MKRNPNQLEFISRISPDGETLILNPTDNPPQGGSMNNT